VEITIAAIPTKAVNAKATHPIGPRAVFKATPKPATAGVAPAAETPVVPNKPANLVS
jgi:hypothetical protein